ncbi:MAG TPA: serine/threonine-protein kinase [Bryobacteraceae bacterium]|nr:serine/threonine-protein kinase [Bryobacteraceae bacterium]
MDQGRWQRVAELYEAASERPPAEWSAYLAAASGGDDDLQQEVESLLSQEIARDGVLEEVARDATQLRTAAARRVPVTIGRYRIVRMIGEGGMGVVYEAEQDHPRRTVALKLLKAGFANPELLRRFERESEALGRLQHPGIAQIFEAGTADTDLGRQPYFAMELVGGRTLLQYANGGTLNTRQRLELMAKICDAVQHAHQRGIVHRDLKPNNILIDAGGQPKILDFGVARITDSDADATRQTDVGDLVGTLAYMSPEQALGDPLEIDARSDIYSLGVILYELLAGRQPYQVSRNVVEAARVIREEEGSSLGTVNRSFRGDLETIVHKALEKDKTRRYTSAAEFGADIRRYLSDEPIVARPPSTAYQLRKFGLRHKSLVGAVAAVFLALVAAVLVSTRAAIRANLAQHEAVAARDQAIRASQEANRQRQRAEQERNHALEETRRADTEAATARAVNDFLQNDLLAKASVQNQSTPDTKPDPDLKVRTTLDRAAARIAARHDFPPAVEASIRNTIGNAYMNLGLFAEAEPQLERALELRRRALGPNDRETQSTAQYLAQAYITLGKYDKADPLVGQAVKVLKRDRGERDPATIAAIGQLANLIAERRGDFSRAEILASQALDLSIRTHGPDAPETVKAMNSLAVQYTNDGKYAKAEALYKKSIELHRRQLGPEHPDTLTNINNLGVVYRQEGKYAEAEVEIKTALESRRRLEGDQHLDTIASMNSLGLLYQAEGKFEAAEKLFQQAVAASSKALGPEQQNTLGAMNNLADLYARQGRRAEAEAMYRQVLEVRRRVLVPEHPRIARVLASLGELKIEEENYHDAEAFLREAVQIRDQATPDAWERYYTQSLLGAALAGERKYAASETLLLSGYRGLQQRRDFMPFENRAYVQRSRQAIFHLYEQWGKPDQAASWRDAVATH